MHLLWTREELEEMRRADEQIEGEFEDNPFIGLTAEEIDAASYLDRQAKDEALSHKDAYKAKQSRSYYQSHKEHKRDYLRNYRRENHDQVMAARRVYMDANKDKLKDQNHAYYITHAPVIFCFAFHFMCIVGSFGIFIYQESKFNR